MPSIISNKKFRVGLLFFVNTYFFWFIIQTIRTIPIDVDFVLIFLIIYAIALLCDPLIQKFLTNITTLKASFLAFAILQILYSVFSENIYIPLIILSYGLFFPPFLKELQINNSNSKIPFSFLIGISFALGFIVNIIERLFYLTYNWTFIYIINPFLCFCLLMTIKHQENGRVNEEIRDNDSMKEGLTIKLKKFLKSTIHTSVISCILSFQLVFYNNPSLIGVASNLNYELSIFSVLLSFTIATILILIWLKNLEIKKKRFNFFLLSTLLILLITFTISTFIPSIVNVFLFGVLNIFLILLLILLFTNLKEHNYNFSFIFCFGGNLVLYTLCAMIGLSIIFLWINILTILIFSALLLKIQKFNKINSIGWFERPNNKIFAGIIVIIMIFIASIPLFYPYLPISRQSYDKKVLAFYYPWYGNTTDYTDASPGIVDPAGSSWVHWDGSGLNPPSSFASTNTPQMGLYDSNDPELIEYHFNLAESAGIDTFICSWWNINGIEDKTFKNILSVAEDTSTSLKFTVYFETYQTRFYRSPIEDAISSISTEVKYILNEYSNSSYFLKIDNKPVVFFYTTMIFSPLVWQKISQNIKSEYECFLIGDIFLSPEVRSELFMTFDGIHIYNPTYYINEQRKVSLDKSTLGNIADLYKSMIQVAKSFNKLSAATVIPGYDDRVIRDPGVLIEREVSDTYDYLWQNSMDADWVLVTSFNEWHEGTEIEPSIEHGDYYVTRTKFWTEQFKP